MKQGMIKQRAQSDRKYWAIDYSHRYSGGDYPRGLDHHPSARGEAFRSAVVVYLS